MWNWRSEGYFMPKNILWLELFFFSFQMDFWNQWSAPNIPSVLSSSAWTYETNWEPQIDEVTRCKILSRVRGSVTNNKAFWIEWLDLLTSSFTITLNYNQLQQLTIDDCLRLNSIPYWTTSVFFLVFLLLWLTWFWVTNRPLLQLPLSAG
jgi:hypothetical protein